MDHGYFKDRVSAFHDKNLTPYEEEVVSEHIDQCDECRRLLDDLIRLDRLVEQHSAFGDSDDYWERSARRIEQRVDEDAGNVTDLTLKKKGLRLGWRWVAVAASLAALTFIGIHRKDILRQGKPDRPTVDQTSPAVVKPAPPVETLQPNKGVTRTEPALPSVTTEEPRTADTPGKEKQSVREIKPDRTHPAEETVPSESTPSEVTAAGRDVAPTLSVQRRAYATGQGASLARWRRVRDSLLSYNKSAGKVARLREKVSASSNDLTKRAQPPNRQPGAEGDSLLIEACFQIARISTDSGEISRARRIIERIAADSSSAYREQADRRMKQLPQTGK